MRHGSCPRGSYGNRGQVQGVTTIGAGWGHSLRGSLSQRVRVTGRPGPLPLSVGSTHRPVPPQVDELYEGYCIQCRLRDGASNMQQAFSRCPPSRASRESLQELGRSLQECTEVGRQQGRQRAVGSRPSIRGGALGPEEALPGRVCVCPSALPSVPLQPTPLTPTPAQPRGRC